MSQKKVLLGISGSIAAYKAPDIVRQLKKGGYSVTCILTHAAQHFVTPFALENVSENTCYTEKDFWTEQNLHISLCRNADYMVVSPTSANTLSKIAHGAADNLLTNCVLAFEGPVLLVPAMHTEMFNNSATQANLDSCKQSGKRLLGPVSGELLSSDKGLGRMADPEDIKRAVDLLQFPTLELTNKKIVVTMGGTIESIDPVRVISNRSSGKLGDAIARLALLNNADLSVITAAQTVDIGYKRFRKIQTVDQLQEAVLRESEHCDILIMAAAVSDFKPDYSEKKRRRSEGVQSLDLVATPDILKSLKKKEGQNVVGFCLAESDELESVAKQKLEEKGCNFIVANTAENLGNKLRSYSILDKESVLLRQESVSVDQMAVDILSLFVKR